MQNVAGRLKTMNRWVWIVGAVVLVAVVLFAVNKLSAQPASTTRKAETTKVSTGDLSGSITASGHLQAHQDVSLSLEATGVVKQVKVKVGDTVKAGDVLVQLDDTDAQRSVKAAQNALDEAKLRADSAQVAYNDATGWSPDDKQLAAAVAAAGNAAAAVKAAQADYDIVKWRPDKSSTQQSLALEQATNNYTQSKANLDYLLTNRPATTTPKINLDLANLAVGDAQFALDGAQSTLSKMTLVAPFDGTITAVNTDIGEMASGPVVDMISGDPLEAVLTVDEVDMAALDLKQPAVITVDTWPDTPLKGQVVSIDPKSTPGSNADVVNFGVHVSIDKSDLPLRVGMTVNATITTFDLKGVLLAPNGAVTLENGKYYVSLVTPTATTKTVVTIGVHNNQFTQIVSGLKAGDEILVNGVVAPVRTGGGFVGGGGGGPRGVPGD